MTKSVSALNEPTTDIEEVWVAGVRSELAEALSTLLGVRVELGGRNGKLGPGDLPLTFQCEVAGYLRAVQPLSSGQQEAALTILRSLLSESYRLQLALATHDTVINIAYEDLLEQNRALASSEQRYRHLSEELDARVKEKTKELGDVQMRMLQSEKLASLGQLAAGVAHEINNPLAFIRANLQALSDYSTSLLRALDEPGAEDASEIDFIRGDLPDLLAQSTEGVDRICRIVSDLKDFSRIDSSEIAESDLNDCLESTLAILANELRYRAQLVKDLRPLPPLRCIPRQLNQVFLNLIMNAFQAMPEPGVLRVASREEEEEILIEIADEGEGIPEENLRRIFEPFFTTKEVGEGTGLGLAVVNEIVTKHGGYIDVESRFGEGTTFVLHFPKSGLPDEEDQAK